VLRKVPLFTLFVELSRKAADVKEWRLRQLAERVASCRVNQKTNVISVGKTKDSVAIPTLKVNADLGKTPIATFMLVDSGSSVNVVPWKKAKKHDWMIDTDASMLVGKQLIGFNGAASEVMGITRLPMKIGNWISEIPFVVVKGVSKSILGMPALTELKLKIDVPNARLVDGKGNAVACQESDEPSQNCHLIDQQKCHAGRASPSSKN